MGYRRVLTALLCALLVVSAGCATFTSDEAESTTDRPTTGPATTTAEPATTTGPATTSESTSAGTSDAPEQLAPGLTSEGVTNPLALANAHQAALQNGPFVKQVSIERSNASASAFRRTTLRYANDSHWSRTVTGEGMPVAFGATNATLGVYADGERVLTRLQVDGNVSYSVLLGQQEGNPVPPREALPESMYARDLIYSVLSYGDLTVERVDSGTYRLTGSSEQVIVRGQTATNVEFAANVTEDGLFRTLDFTYEVGDTTVERTVTFEKVDDDPVERPDWYETALNRTGVE